MKFRLIATTAIALALSACGGTAEEETAGTQEAVTAPESEATEMTADTSTPQGFVDAASASDMFEIESARVAQEKTQDQAVRDYAQMMIDDHTTSTQNLEQAAGQAEGGVNVSPRLMPAQEQQLTELRGATAEEFDALYKQQQVAAHEQALNLMQTYSQSGTAEPLQTHATQTAPIIERHLGMARDLP